MTLRPYYERDNIRLFVGDCREVAAALEPESISAVCTDPPYGLSFMGRDWDHSVPGVHFWEVIARTMKPGAHLVSFGGDRTYHRAVCAIEDAGLTVRNQLLWLHGQGFPKGNDFAKDNEASRDAGHRVPKPEFVGTPFEDGWNVALKPAMEPICLARKPLISTVAATVLQHGTGALNIDATRVAGAPRATHGDRNVTGAQGGRVAYSPYGEGHTSEPHTAGRWPSNVLLDDAAAALLDAQSGERPSRPGKSTSASRNSAYGMSDKHRPPSAYVPQGDTGGASRFMTTLPVDDPETLRFLYSPKASKRDRGEGNTHSTVKPTALMRWLLTLVTPPGGVVLDPFAGSGTTGVAAAHLGISCILIEREPEYAEIAARRIDHALDERARGVVFGNGTDARRAGGKHGTAGNKKLSGFTPGSAESVLSPGMNSQKSPPHDKGRWPSNVLMDRAAADVLDAMSGERKSGGRAAGVRKGMGYHGADGDGGPAIKGSTGGASRFMVVLDDGEADPEPAALTQLPLLDRSAD